MPTIEQIELLLKEIDPKSLIAIGAPPDEYHPEAVAIHTNLKLNGAIDATSIADIFEYFFDSQLDESIALEIVRKLNLLQDI